MFLICFSEGAAEPAATEGRTAEAKLGRNSKSPLVLGSMHSFLLEYCFRILSGNKVLFIISSRGVCIQC